MANDSTDSDAGYLLNKPAEPPVWNKDGILTVIGSVLLMFVLGAFYLWGAIGIYITSHLKNYEPDLTLDFAGMVFPLQGIFVAVGWPIGKVIANKGGLRASITLPMLLICLSFLIESFAHSFWIFIILYSIVGFLTGISYFPPIIAAWEHLPLRKGSATGWIVGGFAIGTFIFGIVSVQIVNPDNLKPTKTFPGEKQKYFDSEVSDRVPTMLRVLSACYLVLTIIGLLLIKDPKKTKVSAQQNNANTPLLVNQSTDTATEDDYLTVSDALKTKQLYMLMAMIFGSATIGFYIASCYKTYGIKQPALDNDLYLTWVGSVANIWNGGSRIGWGTALDRFSFKKVYGALVIVEIIAGVTLQFASNYKVMYFVWVSVLLACEGGHFALFPTYTAKVFGQEVGPKVYGLVGFALMFSNIAQFLIVKLSKIDDFNILFYVFSVMAGISLLTMFFFKEELSMKKLLK